MSEPLCALRARSRSNTFVGNGCSCRCAASRGRRGSAAPADHSELSGLLLRGRQGPIRRQLHNIDGGFQCPRRWQLPLCACRPPSTVDIGRAIGHSLGICNVVPLTNGCTNRTRQAVLVSLIVSLCASIWPPTDIVGRRGLCLMWGFGLKPSCHRALD